MFLILFALLSLYRLDGSGVGVSFCRLRCLVVVAPVVVMIIIRPPLLLLVLRIHASRREQKPCSGVC